MKISDAGILKELRTRLGDLDDKFRIFTDEALLSFWYIAKKQIKLEDEVMISNHAFIMALMAQASKERGRQIKVTENNSVTYEPPDIAKVLLKVIELELKRIELLISK